MSTDLRYVVAAGTVATLTFAIGIAEADAGSKVTVGAHVPQARRVPVDRIDHSLWKTLLHKYVDSRGMVNYRAWKASRSDRQQLQNYLRHLSSADFPRGSSRAAQLAFWINAYNAVTVEGILREYPTDSIRNHTAKLFGYNIWKDLLLPVDGQNYSLHQMEHEVLRKMGEPRIHFAIVCASVGCPRLLNEAYAAEKLDRQLTTNTKAFFADRSKFAYDASRRTLWFSPILDWFAEDFGRDQTEQLRTIAPYLPNETARRLATSANVTVKHLDYDWGLNDQARVRTAQER